MLLPITTWFCGYTKYAATADLISGVTIGLIIIPQSVAYGAVVGLPAHISLLSSVIGCFVYAALGTVKEVSVGPTAIMSLLTNQYINQMPIDVFGTFSFGCAIFGLILGIFKLGVVVEFISLPVSSAFGSTVALTIVAQELRNIFGLKYRANTFCALLVKFVLHVKESQTADFVMGTISVLLLITFKKVKDVPLSSSCKHKITIKKTLWLLGMSGNLIILLFACILTRHFEKYSGYVPYMLTDPVTPGFPNIGLPWSESQMNNVTITFQDKIMKLYPGMIIIPIVSLLVHVSIAKCLDNNCNVGTSNELFSLAVSNFLSSFFNATPIAGAFSRSAVSNYCQVKTPISNIYTGAIALSALTLLTPYFRLIPKASLSAIIAVAILNVIDYKIVVPLWRHSKKDLFILFCTLISGLYGGIEIGLIAGVVINLSFLIYLWMRPSLGISKYQGAYGDYIVVTPNLGLLYPAVTYLETQMHRKLNKEPFVNLPVAVNCTFLQNFDYTAVKGIIRITKVYEQQQRKIAFFNINNKLRNMCVDIDGSIVDYFYENEDLCQLSILNK